MSSNPALPPVHPDIDWEALVRRFSPGLHRFLSGRSRRLSSHFDSDIASEALQELWCRVFERGREHLCRALERGEAATRNYLVLVGSRLLFDKVRRAMALKRGRHLLLPEDGAAFGYAPRGRDPLWNPELGFLVREGRRAFARECGRVTHRLHRSGNRRRNARILRRALLEGWSSLEIVDGERDLGVHIEASSIDTLISRARRSFAEAGWELPKRGRCCALERTLERRG